MHDIVNSKKMPEGVMVLWDEGGGMKSENFNYQDLIDLNVNVLDILQRPKAYRVDEKAHKILPKK